MKQTKYDAIGEGYNSTRRADPYITQRMLQLMEPQKKATYLDLGCGTGNYTLAFAAEGVKMVGVDPSEAMLKEAKAAKGSSRKTSFELGSAEQIPAEDGEYEGAFAMFTVHHWQDLAASFKELERVLAPGGRVAIFTSTPVQMEGYWLCHYFPKMMQAGIEEMPSTLDLVAASADTSLRLIFAEPYNIQEGLQDGILYSGKHNPHFYLDATNRKGISSFASLANSTEVNRGVSQLEADVSNGQFPLVKQAYDNPTGDYLFLVMQKAV
jgi:ubiquinone/menaquinone biosynthesis C-methylase UbiE